MNKKILYVEISTAHTEIINSFVEAITPEFDVHLLINEKSLKRIEYLAAKIKISTLKEENYLTDILKYKSEFKPNLILLNSAQGRKIRDLCLRLFFDKTPLVGIHHNAENIYKSFTQKIIHWKIKKYIVLADFIKYFLQTKAKTNIKIESFYPLSYAVVKKIEINSHYKYILIPGVLEQDRRDYFGLIEIVKQFDTLIDKSIKIVLLGNCKNHDGPEVTKRIQDNGLESRFIFFENYVEDDILLTYTQACIAIMPLMHPGTRWFDKYFETKISGAYNLAFAFNKTLLMHEVFEKKSEFQTHGLFYNKNNFSEVIKQIELKPKIEKPQEFEFSYQKKKLLDFLNEIV